MKLTGLHLLLTYQCTLECDHCFVWGSPQQIGTMTIGVIREILQQARELGTIEWIYFEGGEPFLYYATLLKGVREAASQGFKVGIVSNGYWATGVEDAIEFLRPFAGLLQDLSVSSDLYHYSEKMSRQAMNVLSATEKLGIPTGLISVAQAEASESEQPAGQLPPGESAVMYRGRAAEKLAAGVPGHPWYQFDECPFEDLREPGRIHLDPLGEVHICQGISLGNIFSTPLSVICDRYDENSHPITSPLLEGGPAELARSYGLAHEELYADACQLCYQTRMALRAEFPEILKPDQMYGRPG